MKYQDVLLAAAKIPVQRQATYGDPSETYSRAATIASTMLGKSLIARDILLILHAIKLARMTSDTTNEENYLDGINYLAMAAEMSPIPSLQAPTIKGVDLERNVFSNLGPLSPPRPSARIFRPQAPAGDFDDGGNLTKGDEA